MIRLIVAVLAVMLNGCAPLTVPGASIARTSSQPDIAQHYAIPQGELQSEIKSTEIRDGYSLIRLELTGPTASGRPIRIDWYRCDKAGKHPVVLMSPIMAGNDLYVREFAKYFGPRRLNAFLVYRQKEVFSADRPLSDVEKHFQESIIELRQALNWIQTLGDTVDSEHVGSFAISLGAILTTNLAAVEPRIDCAVLGLPAAHIPEIIMTSQDKAIRKRRKAYLEKHGWDEKRALEELKKVFVSEPAVLATGIDPKKILMIAGIFDRVLGLKNTMELWRKMGKPKLIMLPTGHYTAAIATPYLKMVSYSFLKQKLTTPATKT